MVTILASKDTIKSVDSKCVLTYRILDGEHRGDAPALGWLENLTEDKSFFYCEFKLVNPDLDKFIPSTASDDAKFGVKDGDILASVIIAIPQADEDGILSMIGAVKVHTFSRCEKDFKKICSDACGECGKKTYTDAKGRTFEIQGQAILERAKQYQQKHGCNYETALLQVSKTKESGNGC